MEPVIKTKICSKCKKEKPITDFGWQNKSKGERRYSCRACRNAYYMEKERPRHRQYYNMLKSGGLSSRKTWGTVINGKTERDYLLELSQTEKSARKLQNKLNSVYQSKRTIFAVQGYLEYIKKTKERRKEKINRFPEQENGFSYITCEICGERVKRITTQHLHFHWPNVKNPIQKYMSIYPNALIYCENTLEKMSETHVGKHLSDAAKLKLSKFNKGRTVSEETKKKISTYHKGKFVSKETCKKISQSKKGTKLSEEHKRKIGIRSNGRKASEETKQKMRLLNLGENNPNWKGGLPPGHYPSKFNQILKNEILNRDDWTCQLCGSLIIRKGGKVRRIIEVHHIDFNKYNNAQKNLISLCHKCHSKTRRKKSKHYWVVALQELQQTRGIL